METATANNSISIASDLLDMLRLEAREHGISVEEFLERLVHEYFASNERLRVM